MVCHNCCELVETLYKYRIQCVSNDKLLKEKLGQLYVPPVTSPEELQLIANKILAETDCDIKVKCPNVSTSIKVESAVQVVPKQVYRHSSINDLIKKYPDIKLPGEVNRSHINPFVTLDSNEVSDWYEEYVKRVQEKLSLANIAVRRVNTNISKTPKDSVKRLGTGLKIVARSDTSSANQLTTSVSIAPVVSNTSDVISSSLEEFDDFESKEECSSPVKTIKTDSVYKPCPKSKKKQHSYPKSKDVQSFPEITKHLLSHLQKPEENCVQTIEEVKTSVLCDVSTTQIYDISTTTADTKPRKKKRKAHTKSMHTGSVLDEHIPHKKKCVYNSKDKITTEKQNLSDTNAHKEIKTPLHVSEPVTDDPELNIFACKMCSKLYDTSEELQVHQRRHLNCKYCGHRKSSVRRLKIHEKHNCLKKSVALIAKGELRKDGDIESIVHKYPDAFTPDNILSNYDRTDNAKKNCSATKLPELDEKKNTSSSIKVSHTSIDDHANITFNSPVLPTLDYVDELQVINVPKRKTVLQIDNTSCKPSVDSAPHINEVELNKVAQIKTDLSTKTPIHSESCTFTESELLELLISPIRLENLPNTTFHHGTTLFTENLDCSMQSTSQLTETQENTSSITDFVQKCDTVSIGGEATVKYVTDIPKQQSENTNVYKESTNRNDSECATATDYHISAISINSEQSGCTTSLTNIVQKCNTTSIKVEAPNETVYDVPRKEFVNTTMVSDSNANDSRFNIVPDYHQSDLTLQSCKTSITDFVQQYSTASIKVETPNEIFYITPTGEFETTSVFNHSNATESRTDKEPDFPQSDLTSTLEQSCKTSIADSVQQCNTTLIKVEAPNETDCDVPRNESLNTTVFNDSNMNDSMYDSMPDCHQSDVTPTSEQLCIASVTDSGQQCNTASIKVEAPTETVDDVPRKESENTTVFNDSNMNDSRFDSGPDYHQSDLTPISAQSFKTAITESVKQCNTTLIKVEAPNMTLADIPTENATVFNDANTNESRFTSVPDYHHSDLTPTSEQSVKTLITESVQNCNTVLIKLEALNETVSDIPTEESIQFNNSNTNDSGFCRVPDYHQSDLTATPEISCNTAINKPASITDSIQNCNTALIRMEEPNKTVYDVPTEENVNTTVFSNSVNTGEHGFDSVPDYPQTDLCPTSAHYQINQAQDVEWLQSDFSGQSEQGTHGVMDLLEQYIQSVEKQSMIDNPAYKHHPLPVLNHMHNDPQWEHMNPNRNLQNNLYKYQPNVSSPAFSSAMNMPISQMQNTPQYSTSVSSFHYQLHTGNSAVLQKDFANHNLNTQFNRYAGVNESYAQSMLNGDRISEWKSRARQLRQKSSINMTQNPPNSHNNSSNYFLNSSKANYQTVSSNSHSMNNPNFNHGNNLSLLGSGSYQHINTGMLSSAEHRYPPSASITSLSRPNTDQGGHYFNQPSFPTIPQYSHSGTTYSNQQVQKINNNLPHYSMPRHDEFQDYQVASYLVNGRGNSNITPSFSNVPRASPKNRIMQKFPPATSRFSAPWAAVATKPTELPSVSQRGLLKIKQFWKLS